MTNGSPRDPAFTEEAWEPGRVCEQGVTRACGKPEALWLRLQLPLWPPGASPAQKARPVTWCPQRAGSYFQNQPLLPQDTK